MKSETSLRIHQNENVYSFYDLEEGEFFLIPGVDELFLKVDKEIGIPILHNNQNNDSESKILKNISDLSFVKKPKEVKFYFPFDEDDDKQKEYSCGDRKDMPFRLSFISELSVGDVFMHDKCIYMKYSVVSYKINAIQLYTPDIKIGEDRGVRLHLDGRTSVIQLNRLYIEVYV